MKPVSRTGPWTIIPMRALVLLALLFLAPWSNLATAKPDAEDRPFDVRSDANVDERLFLLRVLENTYDRWPGAGTSPEYLRRWLADTRQEMTRLRAHVRDARLDEDLASLFTDGINLIESYERFLTRLGVIERGMTDRAQREDFGTGYINAKVEVVVAGK
ncbi:MAG TPA: hypothetical protein VH682_14170 [Gemmataceae bacterium]